MALRGAAEVVDVEGGGAVSDVEVGFWWCGRVLVERSWV